MQKNIIHSILYRQDLGRALRGMREEISGDSIYSSLEGEFEAIEKDYQLMRDYMLRGYKDPQIESVYRNLLRRACRLYGSMCLAEMVKRRPSYISAGISSGGLSLQSDDVRDGLERFVQDVAMASLGVAGMQEASPDDIYARHQQYMSRLFDAVLVSGQWSDNGAEAVKRLLTSPTVDSNDVTLLLSAVMLSAMNVFDLNKWLVMVDVYENASDERIRQRALTGWVFAMPSDDMSLFPEVEQTLVRLTGNESVCREILEMQMQVIYCNNADADNIKIQNDIIPSLMKNNRIEMTGSGIIEKDDDRMQDILDPGAADRNMEELERSLNKMMEMQKSGSDVYFGGFSQMKRFPFFNQMSNWFCPFYIEHPEISQTAGNLKDTPLLINILKNGPFCDSDKYSFTLAVASVISRLPDNMKEMLNTPEALGPAVSHEDQQKPAYIRRMILQDMYRFFRLFPQRGQLVNPFDGENFTFITDNLFDGTGLHELVPDLCYFMIKHRNEKALKNIMAKFADGGNSKMRLINGLYELNFAKRPQKAVQIFKELNAEKPDNKRVLSLLARSYFESEQYENAAKCYETLHDNEPQNTTVALNMCVALSKAKKYDEAINMLYRLDIECPDSMPVKRVLAWTLMGLGKYEQAEKEYNRLTADNDVENGDWLNAGYCQWLKGNTPEAINRFKNFMANRNIHSPKREHEISYEFANDKDFLYEHGINDTDIHLMADIIDGATE